MIDQRPRFPQWRHIEPPDPPITPAAPMALGCRRTRERDRMTRCLDLRCARCWTGLLPTWDYTNGRDREHPARYAPYHTEPQGDPQC